MARRQSRAGYMSKREYMRAWYLKNRLRIRERKRRENRKWRRKNRVRLRKSGRESMRSWRKANPERRREIERARSLKKNYGISIAAYESLLKRQRGVCAICQKGPHKRRLDVDHDHATGKVRGLLCTNCNNGLGRFLDSTLLLSAAKKYLRNTV